MATLVRHIPTQRKYIFLGPAYSASKVNRTNLSYDTAYSSFEEKLIVACDARGEVVWLLAHETRIESIDGESCEDVLADKV